MELFPVLFALLHHLTLSRKEVDAVSDWENVLVEDGSRRNAEQSREGGGQENKNNERAFKRQQQNEKDAGQQGGRINGDDDEFADQHEHQENHEHETHQNYTEYEESNEETIGAKIRNPLLLILLFGRVVSLTGYYFLCPIVLPWFDDPRKTKDATLTHAIYKLCARSFNFALYCLMLKTWKAEKPRPCTWRQWFKSFLPCNWNVFDLPDLSILKIACIIAVFTLGAKGLNHFLFIGSTLFTELDVLLIHDISNIIMVFSYERQFKVSNDLRLS
jgi:hypothetical protein